jgi:hypothetical protein
VYQPIVRHLSDVVTLGNEVRLGPFGDAPGSEGADTLMYQDHTGYVLDYLANIVQRPHKKTQVAISLFGAQGAGKGIIFDFFRECVLGESCSFQTASAESDLLSNFSNGYFNKVFIQVRCDTKF